MTNFAQATANRRAILYFVLVFGGLLMMYPFARMVIMSFMTVKEIQTLPPVWIPEKLLFSNYIEALINHNLLRSLINSVFVSTLAVGGGVFVSALAAYAFARIEFRGRDVLFLIYIGTLMIPLQVTIIPLYTIAWKLGLTDTYFALIVPHWFNPFAVFLIRQYFLKIPKEIEEAARLDGAGHFRIFWTILMPLSKPALAAAAVLSLLTVWNDLLWPLVILSSEEKYTVPLQLASFAGRFYSDLNLQMASATVACIPVVLVFMVLQRHFIAGISSTGLK